MSRIKEYQEKRELKSLVERANFYYQNALDSLGQMGKILDEIREKYVRNNDDCLMIFNGVEMARKEGFYGYANGRFLKSDEDDNR